MFCVFGFVLVLTTLYGEIKLLVPEEQHTQCGIVPTEQVNVHVFYVGVVVFCWSNCSNWIPRHSSCRRILPAPVLGSATQNFLLSKHGRPRYGWQFGFLPQGASSGIQAPLATTINNISLINQSSTNVPYAIRK